LIASSNRQGLIRKFADQLAEAEETRQPIPPLTVTQPDLSVDEAYAIQRITTGWRLNEGARLVGHKIGLTSLPMQEMLGVDEPDFGAVFSDRLFASGDSVDSSRLIAPRIEPELAFVLDRDLEGTDLSVEDVLAATKSIVPALEIIDSRIADWKIKLVDTIADNASSAGVILGDRRPSPEGMDLTRAEVDFIVDGESVDSGTGDAVLGHPARAVAWLASALGRYGVPLEQGQIVMSGSITAAVPIVPGQEIVADFGDLGRAAVRIR